jgi:hypothetical protein
VRVYPCHMVRACGHPKKSACVLTTIQLADSLADRLNHLTPHSTHTHAQQCRRPHHRAHPGLLLHAGAGRDPAHYYDYPGGCAGELSSHGVGYICVYMCVYVIYFYMYIFLYLIYQPTPLLTPHIYTTPIHPTHQHTQTPTPAPATSVTDITTTTTTTAPAMDIFEGLEAFNAPTYTLSTPTATITKRSAPGVRKPLCAPSGAGRIARRAFPGANVTVRPFLCMYISLCIDIYTYVGRSTRRLRRGHSVDSPLPTNTYIQLQQAKAHGKTVHALTDEIMQVALPSHAPVLIHQVSIGSV